MGPGGLILNVTSSLADPDLLDAGWVAYRTSKAALNSLTLVLAKELVDLGIQVNAVDPGWVRTGMGGENAPVAPETAAAWVHGIIGQSLGEPGASGRFFSYGH
jgi:NAD(P)-dependent dehydrogenase (short-subunit alcohol dehydrogenase family)